MQNLRKIVRAVLAAIKNYWFTVFFENVPPLEKSYTPASWQENKQSNFLFHFISFNSKEISHNPRVTPKGQRLASQMRNFFWIKWNKMKKKVQLVFHQELTAANRFFFKFRKKWLKNYWFQLKKCFLDILTLIMMSQRGSISAKIHQNLCVSILNSFAKFHRDW